MSEGTVRDIGEFGLIERVTRLVNEVGAGAQASASGYPLLVGIGDDAAAWGTRSGIEVCTTDTMVEGVHFTRETTPWPDVGWKVMVANLSDLAAMGAGPLYALVTLGLPPETPVEAVDGLYGGMMECCREYGVRIVGGDMVASPVAFVSVTLNGMAWGELLLRSQVKAGHLLGVTGPLGGSRGGLEVMTRNIGVPTEVQAELVQAHRRPKPRLWESHVLVEEGVRAAMDVSDGLVDDLSKMMVASRLSARLEAGRVPVHPRLSAAFGAEALELALTSGEEYQLLFAAPEARMEKVLARVPEAAMIGRAEDGTPGQVRVEDARGREMEWLRRGWDHFRP